MRMRFRNKLTVLGPAEQVRAFIQIDKADTPLSFNRFVPMPDELLVHTSSPDPGEDAYKELPWVFDLLVAPSKANLAKVGATDWCGWRMVHWGSTSEAFIVDPPSFHFIEEDDRARAYATYFFETNYGPPTGVLRAMSLQFPALVFLLSHDELFGGFTSYMVMVNNRMIDWVHDFCRGTQFEEGDQFPQGIEEPPSEQEFF